MLPVTIHEPKPLLSYSHGLVAGEKIDNLERFRWSGGLDAKIRLQYDVHDEILRRRRLETKMLVNPKNFNIISPEHSPK